MVPRAGDTASSLSLRGKIDRACSTLLIVALSFGLAGCKYSVPRFPPELAEADTRAVLLAAPVASEEVAAIHLVGARASAEGDGISIDILVVARDAGSVARLLGEARHLVPVSDQESAQINQRTTEAQRAQRQHREGKNGDRCVRVDADLPVPEAPEERMRWER